jgi:hypothetical protein
MTVLERFLASKQVIPDVGWACFAIMTISATLPLLFHLAIKRTPLIALYSRPNWAKLTGRKRKLTPAAA